VQFSKGHGTENDFVMLPDPDGRLDLTPARVAALCDRRRGLGADGVLRVVRWAALGAPDKPGGAERSGPEPVPGVEWFMDYRNADGSLAEMCGNGVRVFARYLEHAGWLPGAETPIGTRAGVRTVRVTGEEISVDMGPATVGGPSTAIVDGHAFAGVAVDVGNPHLACVTDAAIDGLDLTRPPGHDPTLFPRGVNVEFVSPVDAHGEVVMRVHERGVGETRSCGTGTVAAAVAALRHAGRATGAVAVQTPGGRLRVTVDEHTTVLHGPAVLVAHGELTRGWWAAADREPARIGA
jgi:diaminopimelate epimerase